MGDAGGLEITPRNVSLVTNDNGQIRPKLSQLLFFFNYSGCLWQKDSVNLDTEASKGDKFYRPIVFSIILIIHSSDVTELIFFQ